jgi:oligosaccharide repeat unit polymerase
MDVLLGFGARHVVVLWAVAFAIVLVWLALQARGRAAVTIPTYLVVFSFVLPVLLQYPFTFSPINAATIGLPAFNAYTPFVDRAFLVTIGGFTAGALGFAVSSKRARPYGPVTFIAQGLSAWSTPGLLWMTSIGAAALFMFLVAAGLAGSEGMRNLALVAPLLRPIYNVFAAVLPIVIALALLVANERRRPVFWALAVVATVPAVLTGSRGVAFWGIASFALTILADRSLRRALDPKRLLKLLPVAAAALFLVFYLGDVRVGQTNPMITAAGSGAQLFYGNNFSDLRDFAWILAFWDGEWLAGRTQLAGLTGFIPAALSSFRTHWAWGRVSTDMVGVGVREAASTHPGLRPGLFGELYMNFGLVGVVAGGLVLGYVVARLYGATRDAVDRYAPADAKLVILAAFAALSLLVNFYMTGGIPGVYVVLGTLVAVRIAKGVLRASTAVAMDAGATTRA